jgi:hypothetical protein
MAELHSDVKALANKQGLNLESLRDLNDSLSSSEDLAVDGDRLVIRSGRTSEPLDSFAKRHYPSLSEGVDATEARRKAVAKATQNLLSLTRQAATR